MSVGRARRPPRRRRCAAPPQRERRRRRRRRARPRPAGRARWPAAATASASSAPPSPGSTVSARSTPLLDDPTSTRCSSTPAATSGSSATARCPCRRRRRARPRRRRRAHPGPARPAARPHVTPIVDARLADGSRVCAVDPADRPRRHVPLGPPLPRPVARPLDAFAADAVAAVLDDCSSPPAATWSSAAPRRRARPRCSTPCSARCPTGERIVTIEDTAELLPATDHLVRLEARPADAGRAGADHARAARAHGAAAAARPPGRRRGPRARGARPGPGAEHRPRRLVVDVPRQQRARRAAPARDARRPGRAGVAAGLPSASSSPARSTSSSTSPAPRRRRARVVEVGRGRADGEGARRAPPRRCDDRASASSRAGRERLAGSSRCRVVAWPCSSAAAAGRPARPRRSLAPRHAPIGPPGHHRRWRWRRPDGRRSRRGRVVRAGHARELRAGRSLTVRSNGPAGRAGAGAGLLPAGRGRCGAASRCRSPSPARRRAGSSRSASWCPCCAPAPSSAGRPPRRSSGSPATLHAPGRRSGASGGRTALRRGCRPAS